MITANRFMDEATTWGFSLWTGVPCSYLSPFIDHVIDADDLRYVGAANEGDAVAVASGASLAGQRSVVMFQNSGLGNAVSPLTSLNMIFHIPVLVIVTWRGEPGGAADEPQHFLMGRITTSLLDLIGIPWELFPEEDSAVSAVMKRAAEHMDGCRTPYALIMRKGSVARHDLKTPPASKPIVPVVPPATFAWPLERPTRTEVLACIQQATTPADALVATTGYTGRELYALDDRPNQLYMVGSMGCASSIGLGVALAQRARRVIVLDGDGALLMRLGAMATVGYERPSNLLHVLLDNEMHESTGGQGTVTHTVDCAAIASACGYPRVERVTDTDELTRLLEESPGELTFAHVKIGAGVPAVLPRPDVAPDAVARRFHAALTDDRMGGD